MGTFAIERLVAVPPRQVRGIITDWAGYGRWMPLTTMRLDQGPARIGRLPAPLTDRVSEALFTEVIDDLAAEAVRASGQPTAGRP